MNPIEYARAKGWDKIKVHIEPHRYSGFVDGKDAIAPEELHDSGLKMETARLAKEHEDKERAVFWVDLEQMEPTNQTNVELTIEPAN